MKPIFVTGHARSGTSLMTGTIAACGAWTGPTLPGRKWNPKGFYENQQLKEVLWQHLDDCGYPRRNRGDAVLPDRMITEPIEDLRQRFERIMTDQGYTGTQPWVFKGCRLLYMWPQFRRVWPDARWLITHREQEQIIRSCLRTPFMRNRTDADGWKELLDQQQLFLQQLAQHDNVMVVDPSQEGHRRDAVAFAGLTWTLQAEQFYDQAIWNRKEVPAAGS